MCALHRRGQVPLHLLLGHRRQIQIRKGVFIWALQAMLLSLRTIALYQTLSINSLRRG
jgi:hypothetical protein